MFWCVWRSQQIIRWPSVYDLGELAGRRVQETGREKKQRQHNSCLGGAMSSQSLPPSKGAPMAPEGESRGCHPRKPAALMPAYHLLPIWAKKQTIVWTEALPSCCHWSNTLEHIFFFPSCFAHVKICKSLFASRRLQRVIVYVWVRARRRSSPSEKNVHRSSALAQRGLGVWRWEKKENSGTLSVLHFL